MKDDKVVSAGGKDEEGGGEREANMNPELTEMFYMGKK